VDSFAVVCNVHFTAFSHFRLFIVIIIIIIIAIIINNNNWRTLGRVHTSTTRHTEIGTVSLPASSRCVHVNEWMLILTIVPVQPRTWPRSTREAQHSLCGATYDRLVSRTRPDHFQNSIDSSLFRDPPMPQISCKSTHNPLTFSPNSHTNTAQDVTSANLWQR